MKSNWIIEKENISTNTPYHRQPSTESLAMTQMLCLSSHVPKDVYDVSKYIDSLQPFKVWMKK